MWVEQGLQVCIHGVVCVCVFVCSVVLWDDHGICTAIEVWPLAVSPTVHPFLYAGGAHSQSEPIVTVGNIPYDATEEELTPIFSKVGEVVSFR